LHIYRIWSTTQLATSPPTATHCLYIYTVRLFWEGGRVEGGEREGGGAIVHKRGSKIPT
jgi:hypothetical protein